MTNITVRETVRSNGSASDSRRRATKPLRGDKTPPAQIRVFVAAENRLLREALARVLSKGGCVEVITANPAVPFQTDALLDARPDILLLSSRGSIEEDLAAIQQVRSEVPTVRILMIGMPNEERAFFQCGLAGVSGYLLRDASAGEVLQGVQAVHAGEAVCPGALCAVLFRYFESDATSLPCTSRK